MAPQRREEHSAPLRFDWAIFNCLVKANLQTLRMDYPGAICRAASCPLPSGLFVT